ncbi:MAG: hypothetical protein HUU20_28205 [Pirellulales bacterium]|nr:hypothetical protein [Pirellulales bacterium]
MKASVSIELLWQMAAQEAIAGESAEIEPEHFFAATLKFAELPVAELGNLAPGAQVPKELAAEVDTVREQLQGRAIDSTRARRDLRARLRKGGSPHDGGQKHRSKTCREMFDAAAKIADDAGSEALAVEHVLAALLASPTEAMRAVLGDALAAKAPKRSEMPLLDQFGQDLVRLAADGKLAAVLERQAESNNLLRLLADPKRSSVVLVTNSDHNARSVVATAAQAIASSEAPARMKGRRIVDASAAKPSGSKLAEVLERLGKLLGEAASAEEVVLLVPAIEAPANPNERSPWADLLKKSIDGGSVQCICRANVTAYERWIKKDHVWKKHAQVMWIEDRAAGEIPWEL